MSRAAWLMPGWSFAVVPMEAVMGEHRVSPRALRVLTYLAWRAGGTGSAFPGIRRMAEDLEVSDDTIRRALGELQEKGWLTVEERFDEVTGGQMTNLYRLRNPAQDDTPPAKVTVPPPQSSDPNDKRKNDKYITDADASVDPPDTRRAQRSDSFPVSRETEQSKDRASPPTSLAGWLEAVESARNKVAAVRWMVTVLYPRHKPPAYSWVGKTMAVVGDWREMVRYLWRVALDSPPPDQDVLAWVMQLHRRDCERRRGLPPDSPVFAGDDGFDYDQLAIRAT